MTTGASWPWNLSTVPTRTPGQTGAAQGARPARCRARRRGCRSACQRRASRRRASIHVELRRRAAPRRGRRSPRPPPPSVLVARRARPATSQRPAPSNGRCRRGAGARRPGCGCEPAVVEELRRERADRRVQPPGLRRGTGRGRRASSRVRRARGAPGPTTLGAVRVARPAAAARAAAGRRAARGSSRRATPPARWRATSGRPRRRRARRRRPACSGARPQPRGAAEHVHLAASRSRPARRRCRSILAGWPALVVPPSSCLCRAAAPATPSVCRRLLPTASSRLRITLWLTAVTPTFLPAATSAQIIRGARCRSCRRPAAPGSRARCDRGRDRDARRHRALVLARIEPEACPARAGAGRPKQQVRAGSRAARRAVGPPRARAKAQQRLLR